MICCQSAIDRPYVVSIDGKYEAGPCVGQGGESRPGDGHTIVVKVPGPVSYTHLTLPTNREV